MPLRNSWSFNPGELRVAEQLQERISGGAVYFPVRDIGIDLLLVKGDHHISIQVKESRYYEGKDWHNSWHQVSESNLNPGSTSRRVSPDYYIFLTHVPRVGITNQTSFAEMYLVVPTADLRAKAFKKKASSGKYSFQFSFEEGKVVDNREPLEVDYTKFLDKWDLLTVE